MKTIDEVIDLFDKGCIRPCVECPCYGMKDCQEQLAAESYYLHKYQEIEDEYEELKDWWAEEHAENVPLSWDELKLMEGKPVWVKIGGYIGQWSIVHMITPHLFARYYAWPKSPDDPMKALAAELNKENYGKTWKTYRKELK